MKTVFCIIERKSHMMISALRMDLNNLFKPKYRVTDIIPTPATAAKNQQQQNLQHLGLKHPFP